MDYEKITNAILNYAEKGDGYRSLMLTGPWGSGKSHYIKNYLSEQLTTRKPIIISLYGVNRIEDLYKRIYIDSLLYKIRKFKWFERTKNIFTWSSIVCTSFLGSILKFHNVNISISKSKLNKIYKNLNLNNKFIVLEDLERSGIDINEVMGFANNLLEYGNVKMLFVANEKEIYSDNEKSLIKYNIYKEKIISETLKFKCQFNIAFQNILKSFNKMCSTFLSCYSDEFSERIQHIYKGNLRTIIYACQITGEIFSEIENIDLEFFRAILEQNIFYLIKEKNNKVFINNIGNVQLRNLKVNDYLYTISENFIESHFVDVDMVQKSMNEFVKQTNKKLNNDKIYIYFNKLLKFYNYSEDEVEDSFQQLFLDLEKNTIDIENYLIIAKGIIQIRGIVSDLKIDKCKLTMIKNIIEFGKSNKQNTINFNPSALVIDKDKYSEYEKFNKEIASHINKYCIKIPDAYYEIENYDQFISFLQENENHFIINASFLDNVKIPLLIKLIEICSNEKIRYLIEVFYNFFQNYDKRFIGDVSNLNILHSQLTKLLKNESNLDKIGKYNISNFTKEVDKAIKKINGEI